MQLVLSLFPGLDLFALAFEAEGFTVVRGPDLIWGNDIRDFHMPPGRVDGVIGGPPCQAFSRLRFINPKAGRHGDMIPEFTRIVEEAQPTWFVMENAREAYVPEVPGYTVDAHVLNNRWMPDKDGVGAEQNRVRRMSFGTRDGRRLPIQMAAVEAPLMEMAVVGSGVAVPIRYQTGKRLNTRLVRPQAVTGSHDDVTLHDMGLPRRTVKEMLRLQGLPEDYLDECPLTDNGKRKMIGNAVPMAMGRAVARAVKRAFEIE